MSAKEGRPLSTADLARPNDMRGIGEDEVQAREGMAERPAPRDERPADPGRMPGVGSDRPAANERTQIDASPRVDRVGHERPPLFPEQEAVDVRRRWSDVQAGFVDEPRRAVEQADTLVAEVMKRLAETFAAERASLEHQWDRGDNVTTEDLRIALQRYRSFFDRLLTF